MTFLFDSYLDNQNIQQNMDAHITFPQSSQLDKESTNNHLNSRQWIVRITVISKPNANVIRHTSTVPISLIAWAVAAYTLPNLPRPISCRIARAAGGSSHWNRGCSAVTSGAVLKIDKVDPRLTRRFLNDSFLPAQCFHINLNIIKATYSQFQMQSNKHVQSLNSAKRPGLDETFLAV